ncbi:MAG TPA: isoleucine--tRNA ligase, partial [bacterium]|nr:isoleucine--tRNA ligase [bacterium]
MFRPVGELDFIAIYKHILAFWDENKCFQALVDKNRRGPRFSFLDGPITANNPMGVHHGWGRTLKDLYQRYYAMQGFHQRYQNGFDCQGLWVEVEVEKDLGLNSKREIENYGLDKFSRKCRERVNKFSQVQTQQSISLGQWMDWPNSYYTMSDTNVESIWHFLKVCHERDWLYLGHRAMPWCSRCETSLSQHEMLETYYEMTHKAVYVRFPLKERPGESLLVWTTTPWTLLANVAAAVHPELEYLRIQAGEQILIVGAETVQRVGTEGKDYQVLGKCFGRDLLGLHYSGPFDDLDAAKQIDHRVIAWDMVGSQEGTGIVHIAPGCGQEDFELSGVENLQVIQPVDETGTYLEGFGEFTGKRVQDLQQAIFTDLKRKGIWFKTESYTHRYPSCWRCGEELIFRLVDEWFISSEEIRPQMREANSRVRWIPSHMQKRMDDWLMNMGDWCISRKRYWGLPLPFYSCKACGHLNVIGSLNELRERATEPFELPELHRPWIDAVKIRCEKCGQPVGRITDVGDCWLDAGIVPFSTMKYFEDPAYWKEWFPVEMILEMRAQLRCWFYSLLFMSVALEKTAPYKCVMTHEKVLAEDGREMHKSWGNAIWFDEAVEKMGPDVVRWMYLGQATTEPLRFGYGPSREIKRKFLQFWNVYSFFVLYAQEDKPGLVYDCAPRENSRLLDRWLISRVNSAAALIRASVENYEVRKAVIAIENLWEDLSNWYVRRNRRRFWKEETGPDKIAGYQALYYTLTTACRLMAPFVPFVSEHIYQNLVRSLDTSAPESIHHTSYPACDQNLVDTMLEEGVAMVQQAVSVGLAARNAAGQKVRQPLACAMLVVPEQLRETIRQFEQDILDELNVKEMRFLDDPGPYIRRNVALDMKSLKSRLGKEAGAVKKAWEEVNQDQAYDALSAGTDFTLDLPDGPLTITPGDVRLMMQGTDGYSAAGEKGVTVVLDLKLTPELIAEGQCRELVRKLQIMRKDAGLEVSD